MRKDIAVLSQYRNDFLLWVEENYKLGEFYHQISREEDVIGRWFDRIERTDRWKGIRDFRRLELYAELHLKKK